jgi:hypothetical protein
MAKKSDKEKLIKLNKGSRREQALKDGAYDGRFSPRVIKDKKKEENKYKSRKKIDDE